MHSRLDKTLSAISLGALSPVLFAQTAVVVNFPTGAAVYQETELAIVGDVGYMPTQGDVTRLFSFSLSTGQLLDPDGLELGGPAGFIGLFDGKVVVPVGLPALELAVIDIGDPANLVELGRIAMPFNVQGQRVLSNAADGIGFIGSFVDDKIYSFSVDTISRVDPDGVSVPFNVDATAYGGRYIAISGIHGNVMIVDALDPADMRFVGSIAFGGMTFRSNDNPVFAADGVTGFISSNEGVLFSFDAAGAVRLDPDGIAIQTPSFAGYVRIQGDVLAAVHSRGEEFFDVSDPANLRSIANGNAGTTIAPQGGARTDFNSLGTQAALGSIFPNNAMWAFNVADGSLVTESFPLPGQPNFLAVAGGNRIVTITSNPAPNVVIISGMLSGGLLGDLNCDGTVNAFDIEPFLLALFEPNEYETQYPDCDINNGDTNGDGTVNAFDIEPFLALLFP